MPPDSIDAHEHNDFNEILDTSRGDNESQGNMMKNWIEALVPPSDQRKYYAHSEQPSNIAVHSNVPRTTSIALVGNAPDLSERSCSTNLGQENVLFPPTSAVDPPRQKISVCSQIHVHQRTLSRSRSWRFYRLLSYPLI